MRNRFPVWKISTNFWIVNDVCSVNLMFKMVRMLKIQSKLKAAQVVTIWLVNHFNSLRYAIWIYFIISYLTDSVESQAEKFPTGSSFVRS